VYLRGRDLLGACLALVVAATCVRLGFWQLSRLHQRQARNASAQAGWALPPVELGGTTPLDSVRNRRVHVGGVYDFDHERLWRPHMLDEAPGVDLVTPLKLAAGVAVLVDRGWVASADAYHLDERGLREPESADVVGHALAAPRTRGDVDPARLRDSLPYALLPFVVQQLPDCATVASSRPSTSAAPGSTPRRLPPPELTNGPHLSYVIQWFSFAVIILVGSIALFRKQARPA
jgi:surfeit locus 1 family protein